MPRTPRVFFDTNVLFSGIYGKTGAPSTLIDLCSAQKVTMLLSSQVLEEAARTIRAKKPEAAPWLERLLSSLLPTVVDDPTEAEVEAALALVDHQADAPIRAAATKSEADFLVTGNTRHFLSTGEAGVTIISPAELVKLLSH